MLQVAVGKGKKKKKSYSLQKESGAIAPWGNISSVPAESTCSRPRLEHSESRRLFMGELSCSAEGVVFQLAAILPFPKSCQCSSPPRSCLCRWTVCTAPARCFMEDFPVASLFMLLEQRGYFAFPGGDCSHPPPSGGTGYACALQRRTPSSSAALAQTRETANATGRVLAISVQRHRPAFFLTLVVQKPVQFLLPLGSNFPYQLVSLSMVITSSMRAGSTTSL